jgi:hypothetical protein
VGQVEQGGDLVELVAMAVMEDQDGALARRERLDQLAQADVRVRAA